MFYISKKHIKCIVLEKFIDLRKTRVYMGIMFVLIRTNSAADRAFK